MVSRVASLSDGLHETGLSQRSVLNERLRGSKSPVECDVAQMLVVPVPFSASMTFRLGRYQRKVDVARVLKQAYDEGVAKAISAREISADAYLGLALVFLARARCEPLAHETSRASALCCLNSVFNCIDHLSPVQQTEVLSLLDPDIRAALAQGVSR